MVEIVGYVNIYSKKATRNEYGWQVVLFFVSRYGQFDDFLLRNGISIISRTAGFPKEPCARSIQKR